MLDAFEAGVFGVILILALIAYFFVKGILFLARPVRSLFVSSKNGLYKRD